MVMAIVDTIRASPGSRCQIRVILGGGWKRDQYKCTQDIRKSQGIVQYLRASKRGLPPLNLEKPVEGAVPEMGTQDGQCCVQRAAVENGDLQGREGLIQLTGRQLGR